MSTCRLRFRNEADHLRNEYLSSLILAMIMVAWIASLRALRWAQPDLFYTWPVPLTLAFSIVFTYMLRSRHPRLATWVITLSLILANSLEMWYFPHSLAPFLFSLIVVTAALFMSQWEASVVVALVLAAIGTVGHLSPSLTLQDISGFFLFIILTGFISWLGTRQLYTVLGWAWHSTQQAMKAAAEAQAHRAELARLNKELEGAYHRLERLNHMLILARQEAEEARQLKMQFANAVSHELRSPLNLIIGFSEMMVNSPEVYGPQPWPPRLKNHIQQIYQSSQHLSQLIDDVLDMARIDAYRLALNRELAPLAEVIAEATEIVRSLYAARKLYLRTEIPPDLPPVPLDRTRIRQVLLNLLTNALRFTEHGGVTIRAIRQEAEVMISVTDTGIGIAPEDLPKLFREFRQLDGSFYRWQRGSGLGLAISKQLVELHGGRIWAESTPGKGSTFSFTLPLEPGMAGERSQGSAREEQFWGYLGQKARERKPIIAWTPEPAVRRILSTHLAPYDIVWVAEDADLVQAASDMRPFAIVHVTGQSGSESLPPVELIQRLRGVPFIVCSLPGLTSRPSLNGLSDYLVKPISRHKLAEALKRLDRDIHRILIIEDEAAMREFLTTALATIRPQCQVFEAEDGQQALRLATDLRPDAILLDLTLPDVEGLDLAGQIHALTDRQVPIIAVTARDHPAEPLTDEPDFVYCARLGRFNQREIGRLLNAMLEALSPGAVSEHRPPATPPLTAGAAPASSRSGPRPAQRPAPHRPTQNRQ
jgi:signal transduction histidine kinase/CheY-like chemotaxis protein